MVLGLSALLAVGTATAAHADDDDPLATFPAVNSVVSKAPDHLTLTMPDDVSSAGATATVFGADHKKVASGPLTASATDPTTWSLPLPQLEKGIYTVVWTTGQAADSGSFAFSVDPSGASPATVRQTKPVVALKPFQDVLIEWLPWVSCMVLGGALALGLTVLRPALRATASQVRADAALSDPDPSQRIDRRLLAVGLVSSAVFAVAQFAKVAYGLGEDHFAFGEVGGTLTADWPGVLAAVQLLAGPVGLVVLALALFGPLQGSVGRGRAMAAGTGLAAAYLVADTLPTEAPADVLRTVVNTVFTAIHLLAPMFWIGGLVGLVAVAVASTVAVERRRTFWPVAVRRFSTVGLAGVGLMVMSGLWLTWAHVDGPSQLLSTLYGRTLSVKLLLFGGLVLVGAVHEFVIMPRVEAYRATGDGSAVTRVIAGNFRAAVAVEVVLGLSVLMIVPMLSGSARNQDLQAKASDLTRTAKAGDVTVSLRPSGLVPGLTDYDVTVSDPKVKAVTLSFASLELGVPANVVTAASTGDGTYRTSGFYTPIVGTWDVQVFLDGKASPAAFSLPVAAKEAKLPKAKAKELQGSTWLWGTAETALLVLLLGGAAVTSRRYSAWRVARAVAAGAGSGDSALAGSARR